MSILIKESRFGTTYKNVIGFDPVRCQCKTISMRNLQSGGKTLFELQRLVGGIDYDLISLKLRQLEEIGLIYKRVSTTYPVETRYFLTIKGWGCVRSLRSFDVDGMAV